MMQMSAFAHRLLVDTIEESNLMLLLKTLNERVNIISALRCAWIKLLRACVLTAVCFWQFLTRSR